MNVKALLTTLREWLAGSITKFNILSSSFRMSNYITSSWKCLVIKVLLTYLPVCRTPLQGRNLPSAHFGDVIQSGC